MKQSSQPNMEQGMLFFLDSDVDEAEMKSVSKKLKKLHRRREKKRKERKKKKSSTSLSQNQPSAHSNATTPDCSVTGSKANQCCQGGRCGLKRKNTSVESETPVPNKKTARDKANISDQHSQEPGVSINGDSSLVDECWQQNTKCFSTIQNGVCVRYSVESNCTCNRTGDFCASYKNGHVEIENSDSEDNSGQERHIRSCSCSDKDCVSAGVESFSQRQDTGRSRTTILLDPAASSSRGTRKASCLTNCRSCASYCLPSLSEADHSEMADYIALDCEMVGVGPQRKSALGRCSIVDYRGVVLFDRFVRPEEPVTDYRTPWSGLRPRNLQQGIPFIVAQRQISEILQGKVVVGHAVHNDFKVLNVAHPVHMIRDTSRCKLLRNMACLPGNGCGLRRLTQELLGRTIQQNEHCSVTDARACLDLFRLVRTRWEPQLLAKLHQRKVRYTPGPAVTDAAAGPGLISYLDDEYWPPDMFRG